MLTVAVDNPLRLVRNVTCIALLAMAVAYLMTYFNTYTSMWCWEEKYRKVLFRCYKSSYELLGIEQAIPCDLISVISYFFSVMCIYVCLSLNMYFYDISHYFPFFAFIFKSTILLRESRGEPPPDVVSGENVTLPSSFIALRREAITMIFSFFPLFIHTLFRFHFSFYFHSTIY